MAATLVGEGIHLQRPATARSMGHPAICGARARLVFLLVIATSLSGASSCLAQQAKQKSAASREEVVVRAQRLTDEQVTRQVQNTLADDRWVYAEHVTVTTRNGVVRLEGIVQDTGELFRMLDLARRTPGVRRVVDAMELLYIDPGGAGE